MPRVPIAEEYRTNEGGDRFPRISLNEKGEKSRFTVIEIPWREYVHYLKTPTYNEDTGKWERETKKKRDGSDAGTTWKLTFLSQPICLGDENILQEKGIDEKNCPACEASVKSGGDIQGPTQRFSVNVVEYALRGNTWDLKKPYSAEIKLWSFTGRQYDEIEGIQREIGDLRHHDITLECEDPFWKRNKLGFKMEPGHKELDKSYLKELLQTPGNKASEQQLKDACGRDVPRNRLQEDVDHVLRQWKKLRNETGEGGSDAPESLQGGIDDILADEVEDLPEVAVTEPETEASAEDDPFAEDSPAEKAAPAKASASKASKGTTASARTAPRSEPKEEAPPEKNVDDDFDFDNLLDGI